MKDRADYLSGFPYNYAVSVEIGIIYSVDRDNSNYIVKGMESGAIYRNVKLLLPVNSYQGVQNIATPHHKDTCLLLIRKNQSEKQVWILGFMKLGNENRDKEIFLGDQGWYLSEDMYVILHENGLFEVRYGNGLLIYDSQTGYRKNVVIHDETILNKLNFQNWYRNHAGKVGYTQSLRHDMEPLESSDKSNANYERTFGEECENALLKDVVIAFKYNNKDIKFTYEKKYDGDDGWFISEIVDGDGFSSRSRMKDDSYERELVFDDVGYKIVVEKGKGIHLTDKSGSIIDLDKDGNANITTNGKVKVNVGGDAVVNADNVSVNARTKSDVVAPNISLSGAITVAGSVSVAPSSGAPPLLSAEKNGNAAIGGADGVKIEKGMVNIGGDTAKPVALADALIMWLASHTHTSSAPGTPTSPPIAPPVANIKLSQTKIK